MSVERIELYLQVFTQYCRFSRTTRGCRRRRPLGARRNGARTRPSKNGALTRSNPNGPPCARPGTLSTNRRSRTVRRCSNRQRFDADPIDWSREFNPHGRPEPRIDARPRSVFRTESLIHVRNTRDSTASKCIRMSSPRRSSNSATLGTGIAPLQSVDSTLN
jgi:hypothetical protein